MKKCAIMLLLAGWWGVLPVSASTQITAKVKADRVNLRAKANTTSETVTQVNAGEALVVRSVEGDWVQVVPPDATDFWVHKEFVVDDTVLVNRLNARSGAGINYHVVGSFVKGDKVQRRGSFGEWLKVAPPTDAALWVNREFVDLFYPAPDVPPPQSAPASGDFMALETNAAPLAMTTPMVMPSDFEDKAARPATGAIPSASPAVAPTDLNLVPLDGQGREIVREGELKRSPSLFVKPPASHRLVRRDGNRLITTAYLRGNYNQLESLLGEHLVIRGREYWVEKERVPVIVIEAIEKRSFR